jgi:hypothetical protein
MSSIAAEADSSPQFTIAITSFTNLGSEQAFFALPMFLQEV